MEKKTKKKTIEEVIAQAAWEIVAQRPGPQAVPGYFFGEAVDIVFEPYSGGVVITVGSRYYLVSEGCRNPIETYTADLVLERDDFGLNYDYTTALVARYIVFENGLFASGILGDMLAVNLEFASFNLLGAILRARWQGYPESFYDSLDHLCVRNTDKDIWDMMQRLPHHVPDTQVGLGAIDDVFRGGWLGRCKSVRRALAHHPEIAMIAAGNNAFPRMADPNVLCSFLEHPDAFRALVGITRIDPEGEILSFLIELYGDKAALKGLTEVGGGTDLFNWLYDDADSEELRCASLQGKKDMLCRLHDAGESAATALGVVGRLSFENLVFDYSASQKELECQMGRYAFRLPEDLYEMVYLGAVLHNCLGTLYVEQRDCSTVLYITDEEKGGAICAAIEVSLSFCCLHQAYLSYNRRIPAESGLQKALNSFMKHLEKIVRQSDTADDAMRSKSAEREPGGDDVDFLVAELEEALRQLEAA